MFRSGVSHHPFVKRSAIVLGPFVVFIFFCSELGRSDFGYRVDNIEVTLSQKFPPAIAFELLENGSLPEQSLPEEELIPLRAGLPDLEPIQLEELNFTGVEDSTLRTLDPLPIKPSMLANDSKLDLTPFERQRLRQAEEQFGLNISDLEPAQATSLRDKVQALLEAERTAPLPQGGFPPRSISEQSKEKTLEADGIAVPKATFVEGEIEFVKDGSLAMTDKHYLDVRRFEEGISKEVAKVDLQRGTFSIHVNGTRGYIVGRLTNQRGGIDGEGILSVAELLSTKKNKLVLKRALQKDPIHTTSAYGQKEPMRSSSMSVAMNPKATHEEGSVFDFNALDTTTEFVVESKAESHIPTLSVVNYGKGADLIMLPERMINGLAAILAEQGLHFDLAAGDSLLWGTVVKNGRPVEGATVQVTDGEVSYFGGLYLPDQTRDKTSENGMFAIVVRKAGWHHLFIRSSDNVGFYVNSFVAPGKVTQVTADIPSERAPVTVRTFDAFGGDPVSGRLEIQQVEDFVDVDASGVKLLELPRLISPSLLFFNPLAPFEKTHILYGSFLDYLHIPLVSTPWLDEMVSIATAKRQPKTGIIVGYIQGDDFTVEVPNKHEDVPLIYFNHRGQPVEMGVDGGGFILFDVDIDTPNLLIHSKRTQKTMGRLLNPREDSIQVIQAQFQ